LEKRRKDLMVKKNKAEAILETYQGVPDEFNKIVETYGKVSRGIEKLRMELERMEG
jgi:hypothetical protein